MRACPRIVLTALGFILLPTNALGQQIGWTEVDKLYAPDGVSFDTYGASVSIEEDLLVVGSEESGAGHGAAYIYRRTVTGWLLDQRIEAPDKAFQDEFGSSVAIADDTVVVGAPFEDNANGADAGSFYVFSSGPTGWNCDAKIVASDGDVCNSLGWAVSIDGDTIAAGAIGAFNGGHGAGAVYVYVKQGTTWTEQAKLLGNPIPFGSLGYSLTVQGDELIAGAPFSKLAYAFERTGTDWSLVDVIDPVSPLPGFGLSVDLNDGLAIVGQPCDDGPNGEDSPGSASVYERVGDRWNLQQKLYAATPVAEANMGHQVRLDGDLAVVGEKVAPITPKNWEVHVFQSSPRAPDAPRTAATWSEVALLTSSDSVIGYDYGRALDIDGATVAASALAGDGAQPDTGVAYVHALHLPPTTYCTGKTSSGGCTPAIAWSGTPSLTGPDDFVVLGQETAPGKPGLFFWSRGERATVPFLGGTLCVLPPLERTPIQLASGIPPCGASYSFPFDQALMTSEGLAIGERFNGQYWMRDPNHPDGTGVALSDAIEVYLHP